MKKRNGNADSVQGNRMMQKFFVVSYDERRRQTFFHWALADTKDAAMEMVAAARPHAVPCDALTVGEMRAMADSLEAATEKQVRSFMATLTA